MTPNEFRAKVLLELKVTAAGETASGGDDSVVNDEYTLLHAEFTERNKIWWNLDDSIPDAVGNAMSVILADRLSGQFGLPLEDRADLARRASRGHKVLSDVGDQGMGVTATVPEYY